MGLPILGPVFCIPSYLVLFSALATAMVCTATLAASATACAIVLAICVQLPSSVYVFFAASVFHNCLCLPI